MKLSTFKETVKTVENLNFELPNGTFVPAHYHLTEIGYINKKFMDCGGTMRAEEVVSLQLWHSDDFDHRLKPQKLLNIIALSEQKLGIGDFEIEVEYQSETLGKYGLDFNGTNFVLTTKATACLASEQCLVPEKKAEFPNLANASACCSTNSSCC